MPEKKSPTITLPKDEVIINALRRKLEEYESRFVSYLAPELQLDLIFKIRIIEELFENSTVNTWDFSREWEKAHPSLWDYKMFNNACGVIEDYIKTGGKNCRGGTGLPK